MHTDKADQDTIKAVRHAVKDHLAHAASECRLIARAARADRAALSGPIIGDGLFAWWNALFNRAEPGLARIFSEEELAALTQYDFLIRRFHECGSDRGLPIEQFVHTTTYRQISDAARRCYESLA